MSTRHRIAYVSLDSAEDVSTWSGLNYRIASALEAQDFEVLKMGAVRSALQTFASKVRARLKQVITRRRYLWTRDTWLLQSYGRQLAQRLETAEYDLVFSPGTEAIAYLPSSVTRPVVFWTDAPFSAMLDYYPWYSGLHEEAAEEALAFDRRALSRAAVAIYSSAWAADAARTQCRHARIEVVPFGGNVRAPVESEALAKLVQERVRAPWRFLFVGVDWKRKGGDLAVAVVGELNARGYPSELVIAGCRPPVGGALPPYVRVEGYLSPHGSDEQQRLDELFRSSLFFLMPSQAEAYGLVFCEANSHGVPCLSRATGGIPEIVRNGINGQLFPADAGAAEYASYVIDVMTTGTYPDLAQRSRREFQSRLNWSVSGARARKLIEEVLAPTSRPSETEIGVLT